MPEHPDAVSAGIAELSHLLVNEEALEDTLTRVAELACANLGDSRMAGITLVRDGQPTTAIFTDPESPEIDSAQYESGNGPCLDAYRHGRVFRIDSTVDDTTYPEFSARAREHGIRSTLSLPLWVRGHGVGALNLYSNVEHGFSQGDEETGVLFAKQASVALTNSQLYTSAYRLSQQLHEALESRPVIDQAKGILMARTGVTADEAFEQLKRTSQHDNRKLHDVAQELVDGAVRDGR